MKVILGPLICQGCGGRVVYGDTPVKLNEGCKRHIGWCYQLVMRRGFYEQGGERHRCPQYSQAAVA